MIPSPSSRSLRAFTLIELLTVIAIIAILMGILFPVVGMVQENVRRAQARNDCTNIVNAVKQYYAEYGIYPPVQDPPKTINTADTVIGDPEAAQAEIDNSALFNTLRAIPKGLNENHKLNPRRIVFFAGRSAKDPQNPRAGFSDQSEAKVPGAFYDPWGKQYAVAIDSNHDNVLDLEQQYQDLGGANAPRAGAGAFSLGRDNTLGTKNDRQFRKGATASDDIVSWQ